MQRGLILEKLSIVDLLKRPTFNREFQILPKWQHSFYLPYKSISVNAD